MSVILETKNLQKYFKTPKGYLHAVENVSLSLNKGETMGIVGESGCGKSTLGRTILHLLEPTGGQIFFEGKDITNVKGSELKALRIYRITHSKEELNRRVAELMDMVGLAQRNVNSYPHEFDGGRRQRIGIARALSLLHRLRRAGIRPRRLHPGPDT